MVLNNIIIIIIVLIIIGVIVYFYYNCKNTAISNNSMTSKNNIFVTKNNKSPKKVRFNDNIKYNTYKKNSILSNSIEMLSPGSKIDVDSIFTSIGKNSSSDSPNSINESIKSINSSESDNSENNNFCSHNYNQPEEVWDASFGLPLMSKEEKHKYIKQMHKNHRKYQKSFGKFTQYQTDNNTLIQTDTTINPFKEAKGSKSLKGNTVREIYDKQVAGPIAKPKKIKSKSDNKTFYEDEMEMNGGKIKGTNMCGFDNSNEFRSAAFGNEF